MFTFYGPECPAVRIARRLDSGILEMAATRAARATPELGEKTSLASCGNYAILAASANTLRRPRSFSSCAAKSGVTAGPKSRYSAESRSITRAWRRPHARQTLSRNSQSPCGRNRPRRVPCSAPCSAFFPSSREVATR